ncbi:hypothetical protein BJ912DRAFT_226828 [Pholiota molesta]|nr:hypothetical protein BJ912DRAFT_226828 [Pholiota molesta]
MSPRPILKHFPPHALSLDPDSSEEYTSCPDLFTPYTGALPFSSSRHIPPLDSPHVHFPPTPILTKMGMTHSSYSYDRHPIEVQPNSLALPQRGAREVDEPVDGSEMRSPMSCDDGYFRPSEHLHAIPDVESLASNSKSIPFESGNGAASSHSVETIPFENIQNHSRNFGDVYGHNTHPTLVRDPSTESLAEQYGSQPTNELSASISISIHFSRLSDSSHSSPSELTRKRDPDECHFEHRKKPRTRRKHSPTKPRFLDEDTITELDERTSSPSTILSSPARNGYDLGLGRVLNRTKHSMDSIMNESSSSSACGTNFAGFCDPGLEGCLGGF